MKKFVIVIAILVALYMGGDYAYYRLGWYADLDPGGEVSSFMEVREDKIYRLTPDGPEEFEIRGEHGFRNAGRVVHGLCH